MQKLADIVVVQSLPLAACPGHTVLPARWTLSSSFCILQAAPHPPKDLQGLSISVAQRALNKRCISVENGAEEGKRITGCTSIVVVQIVIKIIKVFVGGFLVLVFLKKS